MQVLKNYSLLRQNTFGLDIKAKGYLALSTMADYHWFVTSGLAKLQPYFILGGGSNILFTKNFEGTIVKAINADLHVIQEDEHSVVIQAGAGMVWDDLVALCCAHGWYGLENLSDIPGTVGAAPIQNIGAYGVEVKDFITKVEGYRIDTKQHAAYVNSECQFAYRDSIFKNGLKGKFLVTQVEFQLAKKFTPNVSYGKVREAYQKHGGEGAAMLRQAIKRIRREKLPIYEQLGNAGSFFKNPIIETPVFKKLEADYPDMPYYRQENLTVKVPAAWLIEQTGLKGYSAGNVATHHIQPLVIINKGGATGSEIFNFSQMIIEKVNSKFGIELEREVNVV